MSEPALQILELKNSLPAAEESPRWEQDRPAVEDVCFLIKAEPDRPDAVPARAGPPAQAGRFAELWKRPEFERPFQALVQRAFAGEEQHFEGAFELQSGGSHWLEINLYPGTASGTQQVIVLIRDITERKRATRHLELLQLLRESVHLLSTSPDLAAAMTSILQRFCAVSGWPLGEIWIPMPGGALELFSAGQAEETPRGQRFRAETASHTLRLQEDLLIELWRGVPVFIPDLSADPGVFRSKAAARAGFGSAFAIPLKSGDQTHALMLFFLADHEPPDAHWTTVAQAIATELGTVFQRGRMQEQLDSFFNRSLDMHCLAGFDGFLKRVNPAWTRTLGYAGDELLSRPLIEFIHSEDRAVFLEHLTVLGRGEDLTGVEARCVCKDGTIKWTLWNATPLPSQHLVIATSRDITERKRAEASIAQSEEHYRDLFHQTFQMQENLRRMSDRLLKIQEHERARISRDLHDEVGQALTAINMNLAILRNALVGCVPEVERRISDTQGLIENTMDTVHNFSRELRPAMLDDLGLLPALRNYVKIFTQRTSIAVKLQIFGNEHIEGLDSDRKTVIYRIVQEGLNNVVKHAKATSVDVTLRGSRQNVDLEVTDNGRGFRLDKRPESLPQQLGLLGLAERARLVGGEFVVASMPERGTILRATVPFDSLLPTSNAKT
jgi:PAS domain S-box-containing protein